MKQTVTIFVHAKIVPWQDKPHLVIAGEDLSRFDCGVVVQKLDVEVEIPSANALKARIAEGLQVLRDEAHERYLRDVSEIDRRIAELAITPSKETQP